MVSKKKSDDAVQVGASLPFWRPFNTAQPKAEGVAVVTAVNADGTVDVVDTDEHNTPYAAVPVIAPGAEHPANGPFVVPPAPRAPAEPPGEERRDAPAGSAP